MPRRPAQLTQPFRWRLGGCLVLCLGCSAGSPSSGSPTTGSPDTAGAKSGDVATAATDTAQARPGRKGRVARSQMRSYAQLLTSMDTEIRELKALHRRDGGWLSLARVGRAQLERARLTGDFVDYAEAGATFERAMKLAPPGSGPVLDQAEYALAVHDLPAAESWLQAFDARPLRTPKQAQRAQQLRWDLTLAQKGKGAAKLFQPDGPSKAGTKDSKSGSAPASNELLSRRRAFARELRVGLAQREAGRFDAATAAFERAKELGDGIDTRTRAWIDLQIGLTHLERGDYPAADEAYAAAERHLEGWWLVIEHRAEVAALMGDRRRAENLYRKVLTLSEKPEFARALAELSSDEAERATLLDKANRWAADDAKVLPTAAQAHAHATDRLP